MGVPAEPQVLDRVRVRGPGVLPRRVGEQLMLRHGGQKAALVAEKSIDGRRLDAGGRRHRARRRRIAPAAAIGRDAATRIRVRASEAAAKSASKIGSAAMR